MNEQNLKPQNTRTKSEQREIAKSGGKKSGQSRRKRKAIKEQLELLMSLPVQDEKIKAKVETLGIEDKNIDNQMLITVALFQKALKGDTKAIELIRDTLGEKPIEKLEHSGNVGSTGILENIQKQLEDYNNARE